MDQDLKENIMGALEQVIDPELGIDIVNLGLVYDVDMDDKGNNGYHDFNIDGVSVSRNDC